MNGHLLTLKYTNDKIKLKRLKELFNMIQLDMYILI
jgi:hypothetical protein